MNLNKLLVEKIEALGDQGAANFFGVSLITATSWRQGRTEPKLSVIQKLVDELPAPAPQTDPEWDALKAVMPAKEWLALIEEVKKPVPAPIVPEVWDDTPPSTGGAVTLLMPMMDGISAVSFTTLVRACKHYGMDKISIIPKWRTLIIEARNDLVESFLQTKSEWCIFVDADGVFPCGSGPLLKKLGLDLPEPKASRNFIQRLMSHPADKLIVGALYKDRRGGTRAQCETGFKSATENSRLLSIFNPAETVQYDALEECGWLGFGAVRIHRSVFERMKDAAQPGGPLAEIAPARPGEPYGYFDTTREVRGEDVKMCRRAGQIGIQVWLDTGCCLGHEGSKIY